MIKLFAVLNAFLSLKWDTFDKWLCVNLPWYLRLPWCSLWVRKDEFHPSLNLDGMGLYKRMQFRRKWLKIWIDATSLRPIPIEEYFAEEYRRIKKLEDCLYAEYYENLVRRRDLAHRRDQATSSLS